MDVAAGRLVFDCQVLGCEEVAVEVGRAGHIAVGFGDAATEEGCDNGRLKEGLTAGGRSDEGEGLTGSPGACQDCLPAEREPVDDAPVLVVVLVQKVMDVGEDTGAVAGSSR